MRLNVAQVDSNIGYKLVGNSRETRQIMSNVLQDVREP